MFSRNIKFRFPFKHFLYNFINWATLSNLFHARNGPSHRHIIISLEILWQCLREWDATVKNVKIFPLLMYNPLCQGHVWPGLGARQRVRLPHRGGAGPGAAPRVLRWRWQVSVRILATSWFFTTFLQERWRVYGTGQDPDKRCGWERPHWGQYDTPWSYCQQCTTWTKADTSLMSFRGLF